MSTSSTPHATTQIPALAGGEGAIGRGLGHIPALDGLRGLAILLVLWYHESMIRTQTVVDKVYSHFAGLGWCGVDLFFVLSGFLITGILLDSKGGSSYFKNYYIRRVLRIFPLYYAVVAICLLVLPHIPHPKANNFGRISGDEWFYWLHISNISIALRGAYRHAVLDVSWSLAIEEQFYLIWPTIVWLCSRKALQRVCVGMFFLALASRIWFIWFWGQDESRPFANYLSPYVLTPCRIDALAWGGLIACIVRNPGGLRSLVPLAKWLCPLLLTLAVTLTVIEWRLGTYPYYERGAGMGPWSQTFFFSLAAPGFAALLVLCAASRPGTILNTIMCSGFMRAFGKYSYAIYLFHMPVRALVRDLFYSSFTYPGRIKFFQIMGSELPGQLLFYPLATIPVFILAWLSWKFFEAPILSLKRFFPSGNERAPQSRSA